VVILTYPWESVGSHLEMGPYHPINIKGVQLINNPLIHSNWTNLFTLFIIHALGVDVT
jgi:hypothetical protein